MIVRKIQIVKAPTGEAPEWVKEAWVGLILPTVPRKGPRTYRGLGVLTGTKTILGGIVSIIRGKTERIEGYSVRVLPSITALESTRPDAASWWRENAPHLLKSNRCFVFNAEACEAVIDDMELGVQH